MTRGRRTPALGDWALPLLVAALAFVAFLPALRAGFVNWDDQKNLLDNPHYRGLGAAQLGWMWTTFHMGHYVPLSWMTLGLDYVLWEMRPAGYHLTNLLLHAANAVLLYFVARALLRRSPATGAAHAPSAVAAAAALAALLFAVHPLRVESVAWVTERRDVLSLFFALASVLAYLRSCAQEPADRRWHAAAVGAFACALLSKATAMSLPAVLVVVNVYPLRRLGAPRTWWSATARRVWVELLPFALLSSATVVLSLVALHPPDQLPLGAKVAVSAYSLAFYLLKTVAPTGLSPLYEMPPHVEPLAAVFVASYGVVLLGAGVAWALRRRAPGATAALVAFLLVILPMLGAVQNGPQVAADRYTYHAAPALALLAAGAVLRATRRLVLVPVAVSAGVLLLLGTLTWRQTAVWHDSLALWSRVLRVDSMSSIAHSAMARLLFEDDKVDEAIAHSRRALAIAPGYAEAHNDLGVGLARQGRLAEAQGEYEVALSLRPQDDEAEANLGVVAVQQGDVAGAIAHYRRSLAINPDNADAHVNWGNALVRMDRHEEAIAHYREALRIRPHHPDAHHNWGVSLARQGRLDEAIEQFQRTLALKPGHAEAKAYLERATRLRGKP